VTGDIELLSHIPSCRLPDHIWNLRNTLLARAGFSSADESRDIQHIKASLQHRFPHIFTETNTNDDAEMTDDIDFSRLSWTIKSEIGQWIRLSVSFYCKSSLK
jgi:mediator of RNA polymerase II transcription subunit 12